MNYSHQQIRQETFQLGNVLTISFSHLVHDIYSSFLAPILPLLIAKLGFSLSLAGSLFVIGRLPSLFNPLVGILADKLGIRLFIVISPSVTAVSMSLLGAAPGYTALAILCLIMGIGSMFFHVPAPVMIRHASGRFIGRGMSFYMLGGELARTLGPMVILAAVSLWGLAGTYRLIPLGITASLVLYARMKKIGTPAGLKNNETRMGLKRTIKMHCRLLFILAGITFSGAFMVASLTTFLPTYLNLVKGKSLWVSGISLSILQLAGAAGTFFGGTISDKIGRKTTLLIIAAAAPVLMFLFLLVKGLLIIPVLVAIGFCLLASPPVLLTLVQELDSDWPAFMNSILTTMYFFLGAAAIMIVAFLAGHIGLENTFRIAGLLGFGAVPCILELKEKKNEA
jgi:FSR family fosmidomycin resistance protein-like MFS transporter